MFSLGAALLQRSGCIRENKTVSRIISNRDLTVVNFSLTVPPTNRGKADAIVIVAGFSERFIFKNDLGSQHSQLISASNLQEIVFSAYCCNSTFSIQLSDHLNLIISSWEALYATVGSNWWHSSQETLCGGKPQLPSL